MNRCPRSTARLFFLALALGQFLAAGCLSRQVATDGKGIRQALIDLYTDQAFDNLIRAHENRAFVQLSYSNLSVNDQDNCLGTVTGAETDFATGRSTDLSKAAALQKTGSTGFVGKVPVGLSATCNRTLSFQADPVTNQNHIYEAYLKFAHDPHLFLSSECRPSEPVYLVRKSEKCWYWIPLEAGDAFLQLVVATSFAPPPAAPAEVFWDSSIDSIVPRYDKDGEKIDGRYVVNLTRPVPNDDGLLQVMLRDGRKSWLPAEAFLVMPYKPDAKSQSQVPGISRGVPTKQMYIQFGSALTAADTGYFPGASALFYSPNYPNPSQKAASDAQKVLDSLDNIRLQLIKPISITP